MVLLIAAGDHAGATIAGQSFKQSAPGASTAADHHTDGPKTPDEPPERVLDKAREAARKTRKYARGAVPVRKDTVSKRSR